jgi:hypothetical protein
MEGLTVPMWWENQSPSVHVGKFQTKLMIQILFQTQFSQMSNSGFALGKTTKLQYQIHYQNDSITFFKGGPADPSQQEKRASNSIQDPRHVGFLSTLN